MKTKIISESKAFEPVTIEITIESISELKALWCRHNLNSHKVVTSQNSNNMTEFNYDGSGLFNLLDKIAEDRGIK